MSDTDETKPGAKPTADHPDPDQHKGAVEGERPKAPEPNPPALDENGLPRNRTAIAQDVIGANVDETQG
jgi:hypothetical protein